MDEAKAGTRRRHGEQLKRQVLAECATPGASVAKIALTHGLNANLVHKWRRHAQRSTLPAPAFVPVTVAPVALTSDPIHLELQRDGRQGQFIAGKRRRTPVYDSWDYKARRVEE